MFKEWTFFKFLLNTSKHIFHFPSFLCFKIPKGCQDLNHEVELGIVIGAKASGVSEEDASKYIGGYALGLDMTARDWQNELKKKGMPWSIAKGFDTSCPISSFIEKEKVS